MTPENWTDLFATVRYCVDRWPNILAATGAVIAAYKGVTNGMHLGRQDVEVAQVKGEVSEVKRISNGQTTALVNAATKNAGLIADKVADVVKQKADDANQVQIAEIQRLHEKLEDVAKAAAGRA